MFIKIKDHKGQNSISNTMTCINIGYILRNLQRPTIWCSSVWGETPLNMSSMWIP